ncbi:MAG TPA: hypothetical protein VFE56_00730 [Candidatus Binataceae bacterium]|nr:hypothetical protein [Candidatus Binataceae bacterium]
MSAAVHALDAHTLQRTLKFGDIPSRNRDVIDPRIRTGKHSAEKKNAADDASGGVV